MASNMTVPQMGESIVEGTIGKWFVKIGDSFKKDEPIVEILTDKVNVEIPAESDGVLLEILAEVGEIVPVGKVIAKINISGEAPASLDKQKTEMPKAQPKVAAKAAALPATAVKPGKIKLSPAVRRLIKEHGIDVTQLQGSGTGGRVTVNDIDSFLAQTQLSAPVATTPAATPAMPKPVQIDAERTVEELPLDRIRKLIAGHMVKSKEISPHVTTFDECDFTRLVKFRKKHVDRIEKESGVRITYMPFIIKAVCNALKEYPLINSSMTPDKIILKKYYNIGVAVARDNGLIVPVIKHADKKTIMELMVDLRDLGARARNNTLMPVDIEDGTFTVTNAGGYGALNSTPIINQPQVAILGVHAIQKRPVVRNDEIVIADMLNFGMSFDHRLVDGHYAVQFLRKVCTSLEEPELLLI